jgi:hypothetical protein
MRLLALSVAFVVAASSAALAVGAGWHGPGWYVVMNTPVKQGALYRGAYHTEQDCLADKPADKGAIEYVCQEFVREPLDS